MTDVADFLLGFCADVGEGGREVVEGEVLEGELPEAGEDGAVLDVLSGVHVSAVVA